MTRHHPHLCESEDSVGIWLLEPDGGQGKGRGAHEGVGEGHHDALCPRRASSDVSSSHALAQDEVR